MLIYKIRPADCFIIGYVGERCTNRISGLAGQKLFDDLWHQRICAAKSSGESHERSVFETVNWIRRRK